MNYCKVTGDPICKCKRTEGKVIVNFNDFKTAMRRVFTDHANYTSLLIMASVPVLQPDAGEIATRLLENPMHIRVLLEPFKGPIVGAQIEQVFTEHLKLAAAALEPARMNRKRELQSDVNALLEQGKQVGMLLSSINPLKFSPENAINEFTTHNEYVVKLVTLRSQKKYKEYIDTYDMYFNHMMELSDLITIALVPNC